MHYLIEQANSEVIREIENGKPTMKIVGKFLMFDKKNRNGRIYPKKVMEEAVKTYQKDFIDTRRALGELNHPAGRVSVDPERACILVESLEQEGNHYIGKAKVLSTPLGKLLGNLLDDGVKIGVSSRGVGDIVKKNGTTYVKEGYEIRTAADVVFDPSVADAFVECLMEDVEYVKYGDILVEKDLFEIRDSVRAASMSDLESAKLNAFKTFLDKIKV